jgi:hypothetical protein
MRCFRFLYFFIIILLKKKKRGKFKENEELSCVWTGGGLFSGRGRTCQDPSFLIDHRALRQTDGWTDSFWVRFFFFYQGVSRRWSLFNTRRGWHPNDFRKKRKTNRPNANVFFLGVWLVFRSFVRSYFFLTVLIIIYFFFFFVDFHGIFFFSSSFFSCCFSRWHTWIEIFLFLFKSNEHRKWDEEKEKE